MAAPLLTVVRNCRKWNYRHFRGFYRTLLSDEYKCDEEWQYRLKSKFLTEMDPRQFGYDLLKRFEKTKYISPMDMELFANNIHKLDISEDEMIEEIIQKFRHVDDSIPINDIIPHTLVRTYIERGRVDRLLIMMRDKVKYGIFPDFQAFCLLIDHLIEAKKYEDAALVAGEVMLQEDFSHNLCNLLCVYATLTCYKHGKLGLVSPGSSPEDAPEEGEGATNAEDEEMTYIPVKIIWRPHYDDHFDITDPRLLLGKSMYYFGKNTDLLDGVDSRSLILIGLGLYEKFELGLRLLEHWIDMAMEPKIIHEEALKSFTTSLHNALVRDEEAEPIPLGRLTLEDCAKEQRFTQAEKTQCIQGLEQLQGMLPEDSLTTADLYQSVKKTVKINAIEYEAHDMAIMRNNYHSWIERRQELMPSFLLQHQQADKVLEIRKKLMMIHEKEELLSFFKRQHEIKMFARQPKKLRRKKVEVDPEEEMYVEAPGERNVKKTIKRTKR